jgi:hypothetical protein
MGKWLNNFMTGKKKYSASVIIPIIITIINLVISDPEQQNTLAGLVQEFMPTLIALVGGVVFTIVEGINDNTKIKNAALVQASNGLVAPAYPVTTQQTQESNQASGNSAVPAAVAVVAAPVPPWDMQAFDARVKERAPITYGASNPSTELYQALAEGQASPAEHIEHIEAYWDYVVMKADARFANVWGYSFREATEKVSEPGCPTFTTSCGSFSNLKHKALAMGEKYYVSYLDYDNAMGKLQNVRVLTGMVTSRGFDWKARLAPAYRNLYYVGEMAPELLKYS